MSRVIHATKNKERNTAKFGFHSKPGFLPSATPKTMSSPMARVPAIIKGAGHAVANHRFASVGSARKILRTRSRFRNALSPRQKKMPTLRERRIDWLSTGGADCQLKNATR